MKSLKKYIYILTERKWTQNMLDDNLYNIKQSFEKYIDDNKLQDEIKSLRDEDDPYDCELGDKFLDILSDEYKMNYWDLDYTLQKKLQVLMDDIIDDYE